MGRRLHFRPGSFYRVDDRTGFPQRAERTKQQWDNLIVDEGVWEPRQPQDFVRGVPDKQNVPDARPDSPPAFEGPLYYTLAATAPPLATVIDLQDASGIAIGDYLGIVLEDGSIFQTIVAPGGPILDVNGNPLLDVNGNPLFDMNGLGAALVPILNPLPRSAPSGNQVIDYRVIV